MSSQPASVPRSLPRGRSHLPREVVLVSQRERLLEAVVAVVGGQGYAAATVAEVIRAARVSRSTFYEHFRDKEAAFLAAYEQRASEHHAGVLEAARGQPRPMACLQSAVRAYLEGLAGDTAYARMALLEAPAAGARAAEARATVQRRYVDLLTAWHDRIRAEDPTVPPVPEELFAAAVAGLNELAAARVRHGLARQLPALAPTAVTLLLNVGAVPAGRQLAGALVSARNHRAVPALEPHRARPAFDPHRAVPTSR
jgi:AcrR family transcriptional regulator